MIRPYFQTHLLEVIYAAIGGLLFQYGIHMFRRVRYDLHKLRQEGKNGPMEFKTITDIYDRGYLMVVATVIMLQGITYLFMSQPEQQYVGLVFNIAIAFVLYMKSRMREGRREELGILLSRYESRPGGRRNYDSGLFCNAAPPGWRCTRPLGHKGPCAAIPLQEAK